jgi:hypothetical protein
MRGLLAAAGSGNAPPTLLKAAAARCPALNGSARWQSRLPGWWTRARREDPGALLASGSGRPPSVRRRGCGVAGTSESGSSAGARGLGRARGRPGGALGRLRHGHRGRGRGRMVITLSAPQAPRHRAA